MSSILPRHDNFHNATKECNDLLCSTIPDQLIRHEFAKFINFTEIFVIVLCCRKYGNFGIFKKTYKFVFYQLVLWLFMWFLGSLGPHLLLKLCFLRRWLFYQHLSVTASLMVLSVAFSSGFLMECYFHRFVEQFFSSLNWSSLMFTCISWYSVPG